MNNKNVNLDIIKRAEWYLQRMNSSNAPSYFIFEGNRFEIYNGVFSPALSKSSIFFFNTIKPFIKGKTILEIGAGTGIISILSIIYGAREVYCTDVNKNAIDCTLHNAKSLGVEKKIEIIHSKDFDDIKKKFDIIIFALPYVYIDNINSMVHKYGDLAFSMFDEKYSSQLFFFTNVYKYLKNKGRIFVEFSRIGNLKLFEKNIGVAGLHYSLIDSQKEGAADNRVYEIFSQIG